MDMKAQSAMEYLMTYGWAILIIAVVLAALFELGVFNGSNLAPQACIAQAGFVCKNPIYTANGIGITFGQTTGRDYYGDWVFVAAQGEALNQNGIPINFTCAVTSCVNAVPVGVLVPGQIVGVDFNASKFAHGQIPANAPIGTPFAGYVWLGYCLGPCSAPTAYSKVATINVKESGTSSTAFGGYFGGGSGSSAPQPARQFSFTVSVSPTSNTIAAGQSTNALVTITTPISNNANVVTLSDTAPPTITKAFSPLSCTPDPTCNSILSINTTASAQPGSYQITVTGTNALTGATSNAVYTLTVTSPYVQITLNPGSTISGTFQQEITFNPSSYSSYESGDLGNIRFYSSLTNGVPSGPLASWLEGCPETACSNQSSSQAIFWVKLPNGETQTAPGNTIYMVFEPLSTEFDVPIAGEAPQLSPRYAQYDNGANVFNVYTDFSGSSVPSGWTYSANGGGESINNGLTLTGNGGSIFFYYATRLSPAGLMADAYFYTGTAQYDGHDELLGWNTQTPSGCCSGWWGWVDGVTSGLHQWVEFPTISNGNTNQVSGSSYSYPITVTLSWQSQTDLNGYYNYGNQLTSSNDIPNIGPSYLCLFISSGGSVTFYWIRTRAYPPNGSMPGASLNFV